MHSSRRSNSSASLNLGSPNMYKTMAMNASYNSSVIASDDLDWASEWSSVLARDIIDSRLVAVDEETTVEDACDVLLSEDIGCLALRSSASSKKLFTGLFDFADVNAFLTLAATRHLRPAEDHRNDDRSEKIIAAARTGNVPVRLVSNLSEKNPLETLAYDSTVVDLLRVFSRGTHRVLIQASADDDDPLGFVSDRGLLFWFSSSAHKTPALQQYLSNTLQQSSMPSLHLFHAVISCNSAALLLDAMRLMSEEGVSSVAVIDDDSDLLLGAVSVTDIGKIVVPSPNNQILTTSVAQFISLIKYPHGSTDGVDKMPAYSVVPSNSLGYTVQKLLATNAHRLFVTSEPGMSSLGSNPSLSGIVSIVDILATFASLANIDDIDPQRMQRRRRMSSSSSQSSSLSARSRSGSRNSLSRNSSLRSSGRTSASSKKVNRHSMSSMDAPQKAELVQAIGKGL